MCIRDRYMGIIVTELNTTGSGRKIKGTAKVAYTITIGLLMLPNGERYSGEWAEDSKSGEGVQFYSDGCKYEGHWKDNVRDGKGKGNNNCRLAAVYEWREVRRGLEGC
eukprot:TRINITY_DN14527_c0_g1_i18.p2 TRINITY_DN14527_c0_g1~~TRINITY_DN14527_c0_g1_i18.p2  ORF type:complete len:108 (+),score=6.19 TRINITY_DN14527_c0_g1_i18:77-400(+)